MSRFHIRPVLLVAGTLIGLACAPHVHARPTPLQPSAIATVAPDEIDSYYDVLAPYGQWISVPVFGTVWRPSVRVVGTSFVPYASGGRWEYSPHGWAFVSDYAFGPIVFHYGRWLFLPDEGWVWVPGVVWAPAWVDWRYGGGYVGWAPLPPYGAYYALSHWAPTWCYVDSYWFPHGRHHHRYRQVSGDEASEFIANTAPVVVRSSPKSEQWSPGPPPDVIGREARVEVTPTVELNPRDLPREVMQVPENAELAERPLPSGLRPEVEGELFEPPGRIERPEARPEQREEPPPAPPVALPPPPSEIDRPPAAPRPAPEPARPAPPPPRPVPPPPPAPAPGDAPPAPQPPAQIDAPRSIPRPIAPPTAPSPAPEGSR